MAATISTLTTVLNALSSSGVGLNSIIGAHTEAQTAAEQHITNIVANASNPAMVIEEASNAIAALGTTNPSATSLLSALKVNASNAGMVVGLAGQAQAAVLAQSSGILSSLTSLTSALGL